MCQQDCKITRPRHYATTLRVGFTSMAFMLRWAALLINASFFQGCRRNNDWLVECEACESEGCKEREEERSCCSKNLCDECWEKDIACSNCHISFQECRGWEEDENYEHMCQACESQGCSVFVYILSSGDVV